MSDDLRVLELRYGPVDQHADQPRLQMKLNRNRFRRQVIGEQIAELEAERARLEDEEHRINQMRGVWEADAAERIRRHHGEGWSPQAIAGYRQWDLAEEGFVGATGYHWPVPTMDAGCERARQPIDDLPHTDHLCSRYGYGCGVYASKRVEDLDLPGLPPLLGVVRLTGKVVEHERGYRAARAEVAAVVAVLDGSFLATSDRDEMADLFARPSRTMARLASPQPPAFTVDTVVDQLQQLERRLDRWISARNNG